jgi:hypothetical protein
VHELDEIIRGRKRRLQQLEEPTWTWDDWLYQQIRPTGRRRCDDVDVHLVLEATIPPWELDLHRPRPDDDTQFGPAAECIQRVEQDDDEDQDDDDLDPSSDGIGSYLDFIYRRFMDEQLPSSTGGNETDRSDAATAAAASVPPTRPWLHCVDSK